jgi:hypothetical protein
MVSIRPKQSRGVTLTEEGREVLRALQDQAGVKPEKEVPHG